jgi:[ribosomal protein S5]-alanine N-acetyltransferase
MKQPILETERLRLRPFTLDDAPAVQQLAGDPAIADTTLNIPYPYLDGMAENWINTHAEALASGKSITYAITRRQDGALLGAIGLRLNRQHRRAEMGYWMGKPYWGQGHTTEAASSLLAFGFNELDLNRIYASYLVRNPASGRVMEKMGMRYEGLLRQHVQKNGRFEDLATCAILRSEFEQQA